MAQLVKNVTTNTNTSTVSQGGERGDQTHLVVMMVIGAVMLVLGIILFCRYLLSKCRQVSRRVSVPAFYNRFSGLVAKEDTENILARRKVAESARHLAGFLTEFGDAELWESLLSEKCDRPDEVFLQTVVLPLFDSQVGRCYHFSQDLK